MNKKIAYVSFNIFGIFLVIISLVSAVIIISDQQLTFTPTYEGFKDFFVLFEFPLKFLVGAIACFTLGVTFLRAYQFDDSLKIINSNNRFNNYYRFKEEFEKHFLKSQFVSILCPDYFLEPRQVITYLFITLYGTNIQEFKFRVLEEPYNELLEYANKARALFLDYNLPMIVLRSTQGERPDKLAASKFAVREIRMQVAKRQQEIIEEKYEKGMIGVKFNSSIHLNLLNTFLQYLLIEELSYFDDQISSLNSNFVIDIAKAFEPYFRNVGLPDFKR